MLFLTKLQHHGRTHAHKTAIDYLLPDRQECVTYGQLEAHVQQTMAYLLSLGLQRGDRVALQLPKCLPFVYLHLAIMRLGAITLPLNPGYPHSELSYFLADSGASLLFVDAVAKEKLESILSDSPSLNKVIYLQTEKLDHFLDLSANIDASDLPSPPTDPHRTALMIYTSGTTGRPKGAQITHGNLTANLNSLHQAWGWQEDDILLHVLPIFHVHGLVVALHGALNAAATAVLLPKFTPEQALATMVQRQCTVFMAVPTIHKRLVDFPDAGQYNLCHMRLLTSGSDRLPDDLFLKFQETFGHTLLERYGMTETGMNLSNPLHGERRIGSVGLPLPGVEARIANPITDEPLPDGQVGEVQIRGQHVFKGYWQMPNKTADSFSEDGWLRTGDLGLREADGYFTLKGRSKDLIITGGLNVYPPEVELVLVEHPSVAACAVIGCLDDEWGERVTAVIVLKCGQTATAEAIISYCRQHLASYKAPRKVIFAEELPSNALGKVQKAQLRATLCSQ
ncbi:MAG: AMP-binding protein [Chloroflexi bacterium]|jgi:malonyl-CoA/methylmalonyl-CoA synthetase|nr:AMP-binding protein [Chloroflexota bacterium]